MTNLTHFFNVFLYFNSLHVSNYTVFIIRSSIVLIHHLVCIGLCRWLLGMPVRREFCVAKQSKQIYKYKNMKTRLYKSSLLTGIPSSHLHRPIHTRWCINTIELLMMNTVLFETCREVNYRNTLKKCVKLVITEMRGQQNIKSYRIVNSPYTEWRTKCHTGWRTKCHTEWRTKCHTIDGARNTFLLLQKHLASGTELILIGWKIVPNEEHVQCDHRFAS